MTCLLIEDKTTLDLSTNMSYEIYNLLSKILYNKVKSARKQSIRI